MATRKLTDAQKSKYWRTWSAVCRKQNWAQESAAQRDERRYALHAEAKVPQSMTQFSNDDFSAWLAACQPLLENVDIRDRQRENVFHSIDRLSKAIAAIVGAKPGQYERPIMIDKHDSTDVDSLSQEQARQHAWTLKNRLSKLLTSVKEGKIDRPDLLRAWRSDGNTESAAIRYRFIGNNRIIAGVLEGRSLLDPIDRNAVPAPEPVDDLQPF